jgi:hypothetical protein
MNRENKKTTLQEEVLAAFTTNTQPHRINKNDDY